MGRREEDGSGEENGSGEKDSSHSGQDRSEEEDGSREENDSSGFHATLLSQLESEKPTVELRVGGPQRGFGWIEKVMGMRGQMRRVTMNWQVSYCPVYKLACLMQWP